MAAPTPFAAYPDRFREAGLADFFEPTVKVFSCAAVVYVMSTHCEIDGYIYLVPDLPDKYESDETDVASLPDESTTFLKLVNRAISCLTLTKRDLDGLAGARLISDILAARAVVALREVSRASGLACKLPPFADLHVAPGFPSAAAGFNLTARLLPPPIA